MNICLLFLLSIVIQPIFLQAQADSITLGAGGGFAGTVKKYKVSKAGVLKSEGSAVVEKGYTKKGSINKKDASCILNNAEQISTKYQTIDFPFNTYRFLEIYSKGKHVKYLWGDPVHPAPESILKYYNDVMTTLSNLNFE